MRAASGMLVGMLVVLMATPALARDRKKAQKKSEPEAEQAAPAAEPAADEGGGWGDSMMDDIRGKPKKKAPAKAAKPEPVAPAESDADPVAEPEPEPEAEPVAAEPEPEPEAKAAEAEEAAPKTAPEWWVGPYVHGVVVPGFMLGLFLDNPPSVANVGFGATLTHRSQSGTSLVLGLGYAGYGFEGPLQKKGDPEEDTEWVKSSLGFVHVTGAILWSTQFSEMFSFEYGIGIDLGILIGDLNRSEAYRKPNGEFARCLGPLNPTTTAMSGVLYCAQPTRNGLPVANNSADELGEQYNVTESRVPPVLLTPALPQLALRFTPVRNVAIKLEAAYGIVQFRFGLSAAYGLDL